MWWKNILTKDLWWLKKNNEDFENSTKFWICDNNYIDDDVKVKDHCHITGKYRGSAHKDCNINVNLNHKILIMQKLGKLNLKINVIPDELKIY